MPPKFLSIERELRNQGTSGQLSIGHPLEISPHYSHRMPQLRDVIGPRPQRLMTFDLLRDL